MKIDQLNDFYALTAKCDREAQRQADCFFTQAINLSMDGDSDGAMEMLIEASKIIFETLESERQAKREDNEVTVLLSYLDDRNCPYD